MQLSVLLPFVPRRPEQVLPFAALVDWTRAGTLWQGQSPVIDPFHSFSYAAGAGFRVPVGLGVTLMPLRHPFETAQLSASLALTTGQPVRAGVGPAARAFQSALLGKPYPSPLTATREYLQIMRGLIAGEVVESDGEYFSCHGSLHGSPKPPVELGVGVLRPGMARLAGEIADRAITWLTPPSYLEQVLQPAIGDGSQAVNRRGPNVSSLVPVGLHRPGRDATELALQSAGMHMRGPHYQAMLRQAGIELSGRSTREDAKKLIATGVFVYGRLNDIAAGLEAYRRAGVDEIVLNLTGTCAVHGPRAALDDLKVLLTKLEGVVESPEPPHSPSIREGDRIA